MNGKKLIRSMQNKHHQYNGEIVTIISFETIEDEYLISLSNGEIIRTFSRTLEATLSEKLKPIPPIENKESTIPAVHTGLSETILGLKDVLVSNIEKVEKDRKYVPQAREISNSVKTIIDLAKIDIEYRKLNGLIK